MKLSINEQVVQTYFQTKLVLLYYFLLSILLVYIPYAFVKKYDLANSLGRLPKLWLILASLYFLNHLILWRINKTLLTNHRLLIIQSQNLLHRQVTDLPKDKIVNIAYEKRGLFPALFDYGNVIIQQQSLNQPVILKRLPKPENVKDEINEVIKTKSEAKIT